MILDETRQSEKSAPVRVAECAFEGYSIYIRLELVFMNADYSCHFIMPHLLGIPRTAKSWRGGEPKSVLNKSITIRK